MGMGCLITFWAIVVIAICFGVEGVRRMIKAASPPHTLLKIAEPLGFDLNELLIMAGYVSPKRSILPEGQRDKLQAELHTYPAGGH